MKDLNLEELVTNKIYNYIASTFIKDKQYFMIKERDNSIEKTKRLTYNYPIIIIEGLVMILLTLKVNSRGTYIVPGTHGRGVWKIDISESPFIASNG
ncbi:hypothetical protein N9Y89_01320 [bacterium]|nr:hypothetical protein [bacterium]